jgi:drug/metabolite transporter (DMT)-like permease
MLKRSLNKLQWLALFMLFGGVSIVQLQPTSAVKTTVAPTTTATLATITATKQKPMIGLLAVLFSSLCSGFAGKYSFFLIIIYRNIAMERHGNMHIFHFIFSILQRNVFMVLVSAFSFRRISSNQGGAREYSRYLKH